MSYGGSTLGIRKPGGPGRHPRPKPRKTTYAGSSSSNPQPALGIFRESFDFESIDDPFKKRDKIPMSDGQAPAASAPASSPVEGGANTSSSNAQPLGGGDARSPLYPSPRTPTRPLHDNHDPPRQVPHSAPGAPAARSTNPGPSDVVLTPAALKSERFGRHGSNGGNSLPGTPRRDHVTACDAPAAATEPAARHLSVDFTSIRDPFKKRDRIPLTPSDSAAASQRTSLQSSGPTGENGGEGDQTASPNCGVRTNQSPELSPIPPPPAAMTRDPSSPRSPSITTGPPRYHNPASHRAVSPTRPSVRDAIPTPFQKRDKIPMFNPSPPLLPPVTPPPLPAASTATRAREPSPISVATAAVTSPPSPLVLPSNPAHQPHDSRQTPGRSPPSPTNSAGYRTPEPTPAALPDEGSPEIIPYDELLIPTVYKRIKREGPQAVAELDPAMRRKFNLTDKWYARQKKMSPMMDSMYALHDGYPPPSPPVTSSSDAAGAGTAGPVTAPLRKPSRVEALSGAAPSPRRAPSSRRSSPMVQPSPLGPVSSLPSTPGTAKPHLSAVPGSERSEATYSGGNFDDHSPHFPGSLEFEQDDQLGHLHSAGSSIMPISATLDTPPASSSLVSHPYHHQQQPQSQRFGQPHPQGQYAYPPRQLEEAGTRPPSSRRSKTAKACCTIL
ncbi:hypothetical protein IWQ60_004605 [Tieghemiomyces parasiticus]|uniref:Uncharacterized protein n=1 Tax=Tieghemiomyces parasiticus TaxID=78921 RepID=A0A9W8ADD5_9FUNG|nr:hypothetical protein IWQ60_004605 [Tieghemiomyces parasiticus]